MTAPDLDALIADLEAEMRIWPGNPLEKLFRRAVDALPQVAEEMRERCIKALEPLRNGVLHFHERPGGPPGNQWRDATIDDAILCIRKLPAVLSPPTEGGREVSDYCEHGIHLDKWCPICPSRSQPATPSPGAQEACGECGEPLEPSGHCQKCSGGLKSGWLARELGAQEALPELSDHYKRKWMETEDVADNWRTRAEEAEAALEAERATCRETGQELVNTEDTLRRVRSELEAERAARIEAERAQADLLLQRERLTASWADACKTRERQRDEAIASRDSYLSHTQPAVLRRAEKAEAERDKADSALQAIGMSVGTTDEWSDQDAMIWSVTQAVAALTSALENAREALNTWVATYAPDECSAVAVAAARARIGDRGVLLYIADALRALSAAPAQAQEAE